MGETCQRYGFRSMITIEQFLLFVMKSYKSTDLDLYDQIDLSLMQFVRSLIGKTHDRSNSSDLPIDITCLEAFL